MYKTILVQVDDGAQQEARLLAAAGLANEHGAHLVGLAATGMSWPALVLMAGSLQIDPMAQFEAMRALARARLARFAERAGRLGAASIEERVGEEEDRVALLLQSRYADLVVVSQDGGESPLRGLPQYLALRAPRPVLVVPPQYRGEPLAERVVVGWNGSAQAIRAIDAALPLLARAGKVCLAVVDPDHEPALHGEEPGADMALFLARHGVQVDVVVERDGRAAGEALLQIARARGAGLLVAGAFGHSRLHELALGGATRVLLERAPIPLLLAH